MTGPPPDLSCHRPALLRAATNGFPKWLRASLCPDDLVHQTLLEAYRAPERYAGMTPPQAYGYLEAALRNNLIDAIRKHARHGEVSAGVLVESSRRLAEYIEAHHTSPSVRAERVEWLARLADALNDLPDAQRVAVEMRFLRGLRVTDIARELDRSAGAVSLLIFRGLAALRGVLTDPNG